MDETQPLPEILVKAQQYVKTYLLEHLTPAFHYHNFAHAEEVFEVSLDLSRDAGLPPQKMERIALAALFHDTGYAVDPSDSSAKSAEVAKNFLQDRNYSEKGIERVMNLIKSIQARTKPADDAERILRDANYSFFGRKRFFRRIRLLRLEKEQLSGESISDDHWNEYVLERMVNHQYFTQWAQDRFSKRLDSNIERQRREIEKSSQRVIRKRTGKDFGRGVDTLFRVTLRNHNNLSRIADGKANMIISINTLVLSILITAGAAGISMDPNSFSTNYGLIAPVLMLMLTSLITIVFAVLSAIPNVSGAKFSYEDVRNHKVSVLFFSNFLKLEKGQFVDHLRELKRDQEVLYDDLSRDLYNLGAVLKKKYGLLTIAYRVFVIGLLMSFSTFILVWFFM